MPRLPRKGSTDQSRQQKKDSSKSASAADSFEAVKNDTEVEGKSAVDVDVQARRSIGADVEAKRAIGANMEGKTAVAQGSAGIGPASLSSAEPAPSAVPACLRHSAGYLMNYNAKIIRERLESALEPLHLSLRELGIMRILESEGPLLQNELGKRQGIDRTSVVQLIDQLEKREFVQRTQNRDDRRSKFLFLTPRGRKTLSQAVRLVEKEQRSFLSPLSAEEWEAMRILLLKLLSSHLAAESQDSNGV